jgi:hypothetical protein
VTPINPGKTRLGRPTVTRYIVYLR